tara:strand:+ start:70 stop:393 length:324 start_codon:yes stop_codon:yes gene_type:complete
MKLGQRREPTFKQALFAVNLCGSEADPRPVRLMLESALTTANQLCDIGRFTEYAGKPPLFQQVLQSDPPHKNHQTAFKSLSLGIELRFQLNVRIWIEDGRQRPNVGR